MILTMKSLKFEDTLDDENKDVRSTLDFETPISFKSSFGKNYARSVSRSRSRSTSIKRGAANSPGNSAEKKSKSFKSGLPIKK